MHGNSKKIRYDQLGWLGAFMRLRAERFAQSLAGSQLVKVNGSSAALISAVADSKSATKKNSKATT